MIIEIHDPEYKVGQRVYVSYEYAVIADIADANIKVSPEGGLYHGGWAYQVRYESDGSVDWYYEDELAPVEARYPGGLVEESK